MTLLSTIFRTSSAIGYIYWGMTIGACKAESRRSAESATAKVINKVFLYSFVFEYSITLTSKSTMHTYGYVYDKATVTDFRMVISTLIID